MNAFRLIPTFHVGMQLERSAFRATRSVGAFHSTQSVERENTAVETLQCNVSTG